MQPPVPRIEQRYRDHLRSSTQKIACEYCPEQVERATYQSHLDRSHPGKTQPVSDTARKERQLESPTRRQRPPRPNILAESSTHANFEPRPEGTPTFPSPGRAKRSASPPPEQDQSPRKSRGTSPSGNDSEHDEYTRPAFSGQIWVPGEPTPQSSSFAPPGSLPTSNAATALLRQPGTRPINVEQLVSQVRGIYSGLVLVESKAIEVDNFQSQQQNMLKHEQWQALSLLHRTLIYEHHDFFLATFNPIAQDPLRQLAGKYSMPARLWRHGIHSFLEILRHRLPHSLEHMLTFIYQAYSLMSLLYETVGEFKDTWVECMGDLSRYRMAIEENNRRERETWTRVSRTWYSKASHMNPQAGRLYHHIAILSRPNAINQLHWYSKSLCVAQPFLSSRESSKTLFEPILTPLPGFLDRWKPLDIALLRIHSALWLNRCSQVIPPSLSAFASELKEYLEENIDSFVRNEPSDSPTDRNSLDRNSLDWVKQGHLIGIANCAAMFGYMADYNPLAQFMLSLNNKGTLPEQSRETLENPSSHTMLSHAIALNLETHKVVFSTLRGYSVLPYLHTVLVFLWFFCPPERHLGRRAVELSVPWDLLALLLNGFLSSGMSDTALRRSKLDGFPHPPRGEEGPLRDDNALRGLLWATRYFPDTWFDDYDPEDEPEIEEVSRSAERQIRVVWLGIRIAKTDATPLCYDETQNFYVRPQDVHMEA